MADRGHQVDDDRLGRGDVDRGGEHVVRRLRRVDVVVRDAPANRAARSRATAITSLAFMFDDVPEPVWYTSIGKWSSHWPSATSSALAAIASPIAFVTLGHFLEPPVHPRRLALHERERPDEAALDRQAGDREVLDRALGLGAPTWRRRARELRPSSRARSGIRSWFRRYRNLSRRGDRRPKCTPFAFEQPPLQLDRVASTAVATDPSAGRDHAVTRNDERNQVARHDACRRPAPRGRPASSASSP